MWILSLLIIAAMIFTVIDIVTRDSSQTRHMPKVLWLILVILLPLVGIVLWFAIGREYPERESRPRRTSVPKQTQMAPRTAAPTSEYDPRTTEQQLADLEREIEEDRLRAEIARKRAERGDAAGH